ncbi:MAG: MBL fold metallo-hydrolase [Thermoguttaceae bacterium]|nr:MBL fold metallo-hydrolase [Thermoguttaceae bacterium]
MFVCPLLSGSSGNATYVAAGAARVLIDCGQSCRKIENCLRAIGVEPETLTHILVTHAHVDHTSGIPTFSRRYDVPVYASVGTWEEMRQRRLADVALKNMRIFQRDRPKPLELGGLTATFFPTPHDVWESVGYALTDGKSKFGLATDAGCVTKEMRDALCGCDVVLLEANHDLEMLKNGSYPAELKRRVAGRMGHLSNDAAGTFAAELVRSGAKRLYLGHLSKENNTPAKAFQTVVRALVFAGIDPEKDCEILMAARDEPSAGCDF